MIPQTAVTQRHVPSTFGICLLPAVALSTWESPSHCCFSSTSGLILPPHANVNDTKGHDLVVFRNKGGQFNCTVQTLEVTVLNSRRGMPSSVPLPEYLIWCERRRYARVHQQNAGSHLWGRHMRLTRWFSLYYISSKTLSHQSKCII